MAVEEVSCRIYQLVAEERRECYMPHHHFAMVSIEISLVVEVETDLLEGVELMTRIYSLMQKILQCSEE